MIFSKRSLYFKELLK